MPHEIETKSIHGQTYRVYKNIHPTLRDFWSWACDQYSSQDLVAYDKHFQSPAKIERTRITFKQAFDKSLKVAALWRNVYAVKKGDRVAICARNYPDFLICYWACHLLGAVVVLVNAWLPLETLQYCITHTGCKIVILDAARADVIEGGASKSMESTSFFVIEHQEGKGFWDGMQVLDEVLNAYQSKPVNEKDVMSWETIEPDDDASILFTSGTYVPHPFPTFTTDRPRATLHRTGKPKGCLSTNRMMLSGVINALYSSRRALLRQGEPLPPFPDIQTPQRGTYITVKSKR